VLLLVAASFVEYSDAFLPKHKKVLLIESALLARRAPGGRSGSSPRGFGPNQNRGFANKNSTFVDYSSASSSSASAQPSRLELELQQRVTQLEQLVASQTVELKRLKDEVKDLTSAAEAFAKVVELLRQAGLDPEGKELGKNKMLSRDDDATDSKDSLPPKTIVKEALDDTTGQIFGSAPSSVIEAADAAGASILAAILGGKKRLLVDVRDAELSSSSETLVQFIELAVLPVAAGLEGLKSKRNRLKIVFPTVSQLLEYRKTMALAAPEVVALSTLGFDPVEQQDNLVVIVAPPPDDAEGLAAMNELLEPKEAGNRKPIDQPLVVLNHHMVPVVGPAASFEVAYHLRLLSVQYMTGNTIPDDLQQRLSNETVSEARDDQPPGDARDAAVEAAMRHAHAGGQHYGVTRAMVIRAYPKPWHVFVDTSPDTDADFVVAATFDDEPPLEEVNRSIVECLEGSEEEDEIVAQQMQQALESGQLDRVTEMLGSMGMDIFDEDDDEVGEDDDFDDDMWNIFKEDSV
jgi:Domain of unknown function (DUF1995)